MCFPATKPAFSFALSYSCAPTTSLSFAYPICGGLGDKSHSEKIEILMGEPTTMAIGKDPYTLPPMDEENQQFQFNCTQQTYIVQIFFRHEFSIHSALQVIFGKLFAFVVHVVRIVQTRQILFYEGFAFRVVVQGKDPPLRRPDVLFGCAEIHRRHGAFQVDTDRCIWYGDCCRCRERGLAAQHRYLLGAFYVQQMETQTSQRNG